MTPHISGTSLSAQARYAAGVREILECHFDGKPIREEYYIVRVRGGRCLYTRVAGHAGPRALRCPLALSSPALPPVAGQGW